MNLSPESVPRLVSAAASNILEGELEERVLTQVPRSLLISCGSPKYKKLLEKVEDADGEQNELKTLQGQVEALLLLNSSKISDLGSKLKTFKSLQLDQTQKLVQQLSTQLADLRFHISSFC